MSQHQNHKINVGSAIDDCPVVVHFNLHILVVCLIKLSLTISCNKILRPDIMLRYINKYSYMDICDYTNIWLPMRLISGN